MATIRKVYKFGGASVKDAQAVQNLRDIVAEHKGEDIFLVVSAMGKTTNMLESVLREFREHDGKLPISALNGVMEYHENIILDLFDHNTEHPIFDSISQLFLELYDKLQLTNQDYDYQYDQTVSYGELISTTIIQEYLNQCEIPTRWLDARKYVITDSCYRSAVPDWTETRKRIKKLQEEHIRGLVCITQGFIGGTANGKSATTLGREGSDYTAAIFANCLDAEEVTIWKDVDGLRNADPKRFPDTVKLPHLSYSEAIELAFYGASIIHPKTIKPLQNKDIVLKVQSFLNPNLSPSIIDGQADQNEMEIPSYIVKEGQTLVSFSPRDYSFMNEKNLQLIFATCAEIGLHANMIQTSALMLSICFDHNQTTLSSLIEALSSAFSIKYNKDLILFSIRHYSTPTATEETFLHDKHVLIKQSSRTTLQYVLNV